MRSILTLLLISCVLLSGASAQDRLAELAGDGSVILRSPSGETLVSLNPNRSLVPASILKIPLAQVALSVLGEDYRFETHFYRNDGGDLLIRGLGDPLLVSEEIALIGKTLKQRGLNEIRRLVLDDSAFEPNLDLPLEIGTDQPYGARNGALAANFNTVNLSWNASGELISAEPQTPLTSFARQLASQLVPGQTQRINLGEDSQAGVTQAGQLFSYFLEEAGITIADTKFYREAASDDWTLWYRHRSSRTLRENLEGMLRYSNNFIANQIFLTLGAQELGYPASTGTAKTVLYRELGKLYGEGYGASTELLYMVEGSGLSREQRSTAEVFARILEVFKPRAELLPEVSGVLRKSGTLTGVYNFAGYIRGDNGLYPFVILTNQSANNRDEILRLLQRQL